MDLDLKRDYKHLYSATATPCIVEVPSAQFLVIDGVGEPGGEQFTKALQAIYGIAYGIKFALKPAVNYSIMPLEALWGLSQADADSPRTSWPWTLMILQPEAVTHDDLDIAAMKMRKNRRGTPIDSVRLEHLAEGTSAQVLHLGPYADEMATTERLMAYIAAQGYRPSGRHHEIYLSDPNRTAPEKLRTIIRYPVLPITHADADE
jgi:hypothetical protein